MEGRGCSISTVNTKYLPFYKLVSLFVYVIINPIEEKKKKGAGVVSW